MNKNLVFLGLSFAIIFNSFGQEPTIQYGNNPVAGAFKRINGVDLYYETYGSGKPLVFLHGDIHAGNLLLEESGGRWRIAGLIDFGDSLCGFHEYEFVAPGVLMTQGDAELQRAMLVAYGYTESQLDLGLRSRLMLLTVLYECSDLRKYALRLAPEAVRLTLVELESAIWKFAAG